MKIKKTVVLEIEVEFSDSFASPNNEMDGIIGGVATHVYDYVRDLCAEKGEVQTWTVTEVIK